jgi:non-ribosomal peptide synthetase component F
MTELAGADRIAPGAAEAWRRHLGEEVDPGSLPRAFHETAARYPERTALTIDGEKITHGELDHLAARVGGWLRARGVGAQERVVLCGVNSLDFVTAYLGILRAGGVVVPAGTALAEPELRHLVKKSGAACALGQGEALGRLSALARGDGSLWFVAALGEWSTSPVESMGRRTREVRRTGWI